MKKSTLEWFKAGELDLINVQESDLMEIKKLLGSYFANKAIKEADTCWDENNLNNDVMDNWLESHE